MQLRICLYSSRVKHFNWLTVWSTFFVFIGDVTELNSYYTDSSDDIEDFEILNMEAIVLT